MEDMEALALAAAAKKRRGQTFADGAAPEDYILDTESGAMVSPQMIGRNTEMNPSRAAQMGAIDGLSLFAGDEAIGAANAVIPGEGTMQDRYAFGRESARAASEKAREENPWAYYGAAIPGGAATSIAGWKAAGVSPVGQSGLGTVGRGAGMGGVEGAIAGFSEGEGGPKERIIRALLMSGLGVGAGGLVAPTSWAAQKAGRWVGDLASGAFEGATGRGNQAKAGRALAATLSRSGRSIDDVSDDVARAAAEGQPDYRLMDALGKSGQRRASGIVRSGGDGAEELAGFLEQRGIDAPDRMLNFTDDAFPVSKTSDVAKRWTDQAPDAVPRTAGQAVDTLKGARSEAAAPLYNAARSNAAPVDVTPVVDDIDNLLRSNASIDGGITGLSDTSVGRRLASIKSQISTGDYQSINFDDVLETKQELGRAIEAMKRRGDVPPQFAKVYRQLDNVLENASHSYRAANDQYREMSGVIDAVEEGGAMARRGRLDDTTSRFAQMTPEEQVAARAGYGDAVASEIERNKAAAPDVARAFASTKRSGEAAAIADNSDLFLRRVSREGDMNSTMKRALGGSLTADNMQDVADLGPIASAGRAAADAAQGRLFGATQNAMSAVSPYLTGTSEGTRKIIARALMSRNPQEALEKALRSTETSKEVRGVISALLRSPARQVGIEATR